MVPAVVPYALSAHTFVNRIGAYAGVAAIIGIALVTIVLFVHARESAELRTRAEEAEERLHALEEQLARQARAPSTVAAAPEARAATSPVPPPAVAAGSPPVAARPALPEVEAGRLVLAAPVGVAGPPLASATRLIPVAGSSSNGAGPAEPASPATPAAATAATAAVPATAVPATAVPATAAAAPAAIHAASAAPPAAAPPATAAAAPAAAPPPATAAAAGPAAAASATAAPAAAERSDVGARPAPSSRPPQGPRRDYGRASEERPSRVSRRSLLIAAGLLAVIAVAVVLIATHGSGHGAARPVVATRSDRTARTSKAKPPKTVQVDPSTVTVAVLNGTSTSHLAHDVSARLSAAGFHQGTTGNATSQTMTRTVIGYLPGRRIQALAVAESLDLSPTSVQAVNASDREVACSAAPTSCPDQVVVVVGSNLAADA